jgi:hypothetical protein
MTVAGNDDEKISSVSQLRHRRNRISEVDLDLVQRLEGAEHREPVTLAIPAM